MVRYYVLRILSIIPVLIMVTLLSYAIVAMLPGNFFTRYLIAVAMNARGANPRQEAFDQYEAVLALRGLDKPWYTQFYYWVEGIVLHGSLGYSFASGKPATQMVLGPGSPLWWTLIIIGSSIMVGWIVGIPLGVLGAAFYRRPIDIILYSTTYILSAIPPFVAGLAFFVIYNLLHPHDWLLPGAWGIVSHDLLHAPLTWTKAVSHLHRLSLTWLIVGMPIVVTVSRHLRAGLLEVLNQPFIDTARGKGLSTWQVLFKHGLRNALNPLISMSGFMLTTTIGNSIIAATVLYQPNLGGWIVIATRSQDQPLATAILLVFGVLLAFGTLASDLLLALIDPRIRYN